MSLSLSLMLKNKTFESHVNAALSAMKNRSKEYVDKSDFINIMPRIGYYNDKKYPVASTYNISTMGGRGAAVTDAYGREIVYYNANNGISTTKWYRAYRFSDDVDYTYENTEVRPGYLASDLYITDIRGASSEYMICAISNGQYHYISTNGQDPSDWTLKKDITGIVNSLGIELSNVIILNRGEVIGMYGRSGTSRILKTYRISDLSQIASITLIPDQPFTKPNSWNGFYLNNHFGGALSYNPVTQELAAYDNYCASGNHTNYYRSICQTWKIPEDKLVAGDFSGSTVRLKLPTDYDSIWGDDRLTTSGSSIHYTNAVYDDYTKQMFITTCEWDDYRVQVFKRDASEVIKRPWIENQSIKSHTSFTSPDACAWAKRTWPNTIIMNNMIYVRGQSKKYGDHTINVGYYHSYDTNNYIKTVPGEWWMTDTVEDGAIQGDGIYRFACRKDGNNVKWYYCGDDIFEISFDDVTIDGVLRHGKRTLHQMKKTLPAIPDGYGVSTTTRWFYDPVRRLYFTICVKPTPVNEKWKYGQAFIVLTYDEQSKTYHESEIVNGRAYNMFISDAGTLDNHSMIGRIHFFSSMLIDDDGSCYVNIRTLPKDGAESTYIKIAPDFTVSTCNNSVSPWYSAKGMGYDPTFGYYFLNGDGGFNNRHIYHSRDFVNGGRDLTASELFSGQNYHSVLTLKSATGLVAYSQKFPVLINGKCKYIESAEIPLRPSCDNYIYIVGKDDQFKIEARPSKVFNNGENAFNTIVVARVKTNAADPIEIEYYDMN